MYLCTAIRAQSEFLEAVLTDLINVSVRSSLAKDIQSYIMFLYIIN